MHPGSIHLQELTSDLFHTDIYQLYLLSRISLMEVSKSIEFK